LRRISSPAPWRSGHSCGRSRLAPWRSRLRSSLGTGTRARIMGSGELAGEARDSVMTSRAADSGAIADAPRRARSRGGAWWTSLILGLSLLLIYSANARDLGTDDTVATTLLPLAMVRGDGLALDRFLPLLLDAPGVLHSFVVRSHGRIVSRY